ncbi:MAG: D-alanyl-D-alanine carboxypeptidase [Serpentinimonas sp.]|nr:D-alanyl-D-alanine carboxypeptidase [Serpentinimonas sp.]
MSLALALLVAGPVAAQSVAPPTALPPSVLAALARAQLPPDALSVFVADARPNGPVLLAYGAQQPVNPASVMKVVTTLAALELLGPGYVWRTRIYTDGTVANGVLSGNLYLQGGGDPKLVTERVLLLLQRVQGLGIRRIAGDVVLDRSAVAVPEQDPGAFDGEPLRPYNAGPDGLLVNFKSQLFTFVPDVAAGVARVQAEPALTADRMPQNVPPTVPLNSRACGDWRGGLGAQFTPAMAPRFTGTFPAACGEKVWPVAHPEPAAFAARAVAGLWASLGGQLDGVVRDGPVPTALQQAGARLTLESPTLAEVVRDVHLRARAPGAAALVAGTHRPSRPPRSAVDNGSGLSRDARISAAALGQLLQVAYASPMMPELMASFPASGLDGTLRRSAMGAGLAHLKTGSLRDVQALAGYVHSPGGDRKVLVALVNHPQARDARPALDALVQWVATQ